jgi:hypothetical protein
VIESLGGQCVCGIPTKRKECLGGDRKPFVMREWNEWKNGSDSGHERGLFVKTLITVINIGG